MLLETIVPDVFRSQTLVLYRPEHVLTFCGGDDWTSFKEILMQLQRDGFTLGVQAHYELAYEWEESLQHLRVAQGLPLMTCMACRTPLIFDHSSGKFRFSIEHLKDTVKTVADQAFWISDMQLAIDPETYVRKVETVQEALRQGRTYQVNLTDEWSAHFCGSVVSLYESLRQQQGVSYAALVKYKTQYTVSLSPELFFRMNAKGKIVVRPMKGTAPRGMQHEQDGQTQEYLKKDPKNRSENLMIVDLLRNDLGRVCKKGSVHVQGLCEVEAYPTVWQMTSRIAGYKQKEQSVWDVLQMLFPCGSVTGAPKIESMKVITELENRKRGIYTGALGCVYPDQRAVFNVPIRTITVDAHHLTMGVGSGIVIDSVAEDEYKECLVKSHFLTHVSQPFELIETIRWEQGYALLDRHLDRLKASAQFFACSYEEALIKSILQQVATSLEEGTIYKVRLYMNTQGALRCKTSLVSLPESTPLLLGLAAYFLHDQNPFLYHKTTRRNLYRQEQQRAKKRGLFDVLFFNQDGWLCEGSICNVYLEIDGQWVTPALESGLLNGVYRQYFLAQRPEIEERKLSRDDLMRAERIWVSNAIIQLKEATLIPSSRG